MAVHTLASPPEPAYADSRATPFPAGLSERITWFKNFAVSFSQEKPEDQECIDIKIGHSLRVLDNAVEIADSLGLDPAAAHIAHLAALYHDMGRFLQYAEFRTFNDRISADHARLGIKALRSTSVLGGLEPGDRRIIMVAVLLHNRKYVPKTLTPAMSLVCHLVRDADKLDIVHVLLGQFSPDGSSNDQVTKNLACDSQAYTPRIFEDVRSGRAIDYGDMRWINDFKLLLCGWVHDLHFPASRKMFLDRGYLSGIFGLLPRTGDFLALEEQLHGKLFG